MEHTKLPWHVGMRPGPIVYGWYGEQVADLTSVTLLVEENKDNAAFIVRACNAHNDLVAAIEGLLLCAELNQDDMEGDTRYMLENARATLAKAKA